jgi:hypothetical protein
VLSLVAGDALQKGQAERSVLILPGFDPPSSLIRVRTSINTARKDVSLPLLSITNIIARISASSTDQLAPE